MIDDVEAIEPPENLGPVSRAEAQGMWRQLDMHRLGMFGLMSRLDRVEDKLGALRTIKLMLGVPCLLAAAVLLRALWLLSAHDARALLAAVAP